MSQTKRGYKGPMKKVTKQIQAALEAQRRRELKAMQGMRAPRRTSKNAPKYPSRDTNQVMPAPASRPSERMFTAAEFGQGLRQMSLGGAALAGGLGATALASGQFNRRGNNPNPGINPDASGPPGGHRLPPPQPQSNSNGKHPIPLVSSPQTTVIEAPVIIGIQKKGSAPRMWAKSKSGDVEVVVEHSEYVCDMKADGTGVFPGLSSLKQFALNPGQQSLFAWLSTLASNFDEYKFDYVEFHYEPVVGSSSAGKFIATFDPDILDNYPDTKQHMLEARVQLDTPVWTRNVLKVPKDLLAQYLYIRSGSVPAGADPHTYDAGVFNLAAPGAPAGAIGELFVSYKVRLRTPNGGPNAFEGYNVIGSPTPAAPFGTGALVSTGNISVTRRGNTSFTIDQPGTYYLVLASNGTTFGGTQTLTVTAPNTATADLAQFTAGSCIGSWEVIVSDPTGVFTVGTPAGAGSITSASLRIFNHDASLAP